MIRKRSCSSGSKGTKPAKPGSLVLCSVAYTPNSISKNPQNLPLRMCSRRENVNPVRSSRSGTGGSNPASRNTLSGGTNSASATPRQNSMPGPCWPVITSEIEADDNPACRASSPSSHSTNALVCRPTLKSDSRRLVQRSAPLTQYTI